MFENVMQHSLNLFSSVQFQVTHPSGCTLWDYSEFRRLHQNARARGMKGCGAFLLNRFSAQEGESAAFQVRSASLLKRTHEKICVILCTLQNGTLNGNGQDANRIVAGHPTTFP